MVHSILPIIPGMACEPWFAVLRHLVLYPFMRATQNKHWNYHVRQSGYFMTWYLWYGPCHTCTIVHIKKLMLIPYFHCVLLNTFVCWCVSLGQLSDLIRNSKLPLRSNIWQLVEHTHAFSSEKSELHQVKWPRKPILSMPNSSSSINHQLQQRFGGNPTATPAASDQVVDSHEGEFHHGADWRIDLAPEGREWGLCHPPLFFNAGNNGEDHFPNKRLKTARKWRSSRGKSCSNPSFPKFPDICGSNSRGSNRFQPPLEKHGSLHG